MQTLTTATKNFIFGAITMALLCSAALNLAFWSGKVSSPTGAYCEGFYSGSLNAIEGQASKVKK